MCASQFPDPHFKTKHKKRRVIQPQVVHTLERLMPPGGEHHQTSLYHIFHVVGRPLRLCICNVDLQLPIRVRGPSGICQTSCSALRTLTDLKGQLKAQREVLMHCLPSRPRVSAVRCKRSSHSHV